MMNVIQLIRAQESLYKLYNIQQSVQITRSGMCYGSGTIGLDLVIFSFVLLFIFYGDLIKFLEINSFSYIY